MVRKLDIEPIIFRLRKLLRLNCILDVESFCDKSWQLSPGGEQTLNLPAIYLSKHLEYQLQTMPGISLKDEMIRVLGNRKIISKPTVAYQINEAKLLSGIMYKNNFRYRSSCQRESILNFYGFRKEEREGVLVSSWSSSKYFGHLIHDEFPSIMAAQDMGLPSYRTKQKKFKHQRGYEQVLGLESLFVDRAIFSRLIILSDSTLNKYRQDRFIKLRQLIANSPLQPRENNEFVYIKRGITGVEGRDLVNEESVIATLKEFGFTIIDPEQLSVDEIIKQSLNAKIIMGIEGSAMAHAFLCINTGGAFISLIPEYRFNNPYRDYCNVIGINYGFLIGKAVEGGFSVDVLDVEELLNMVKV